MTLGPSDLVLCSPTVNHPSFDDHVALAAAHGFSAISLWARTYVAERRSGRSDADLRAVLAHHGVAVADVDCIAPVAGRGDDGQPFYDATEDDVLAAAAGVGARSVNVVLRHDDGWSTEGAATEVARVCDRAAEHGLLVHLEPVPFMKVKSLPEAAEIARATGRPNAGVQLDAWHHFRGPARHDDLASVPGDLIFAFQLCDAPAEPDGRGFEETTRRRRLPGDGELDLVGLLRVVYRDKRCTAPIGIEIFSDELNEQPADDVARKVAETTRQVIAAARI